MVGRLGCTWVEGQQKYRPPPIHLPVRPPLRVGRWMITWGPWGRYVMVNQMFHLGLESRGKESVPTTIRKRCKRCTALVCLSLVFLLRTSEHRPYYQVRFFQKQMSDKAMQYVVVCKPYW